MASRVHLEPASSYDVSSVRPAVRACLQSLGEVVERALRPGNTILVKPNLLRPWEPERHVTTHPAVVQAVLEVIAEAGADAIVADLPTYALADGPPELFDATGMTEACRSTEAQCRFASIDGYEPRQVEQPLRVSEFWGARLVTHADAVVNLPKCKVHHEAGFTGAIKNMFGCVAPRHRMKVHRWGGGRLFSEALADVCTTLRSTFTIMDAIVGMEGDGPAAGQPRELGLLIASDDPVALDAIGAELIGMQPGAVRVTGAAAEKGHGEDDLGCIEVTGAKLEDFRQEFRPPPPFLRWVPPALGKFAPRVVRTEPVVIPDRCDGCGACVPVCCAEAMECPDHLALISDELCLHCFNCQRACPRHAIETRRTWFSRHLP